MPVSVTFLLAGLLSLVPAVADASSLPIAATNDNGTASGRLVGHELHLSLEARYAIWQPDGARGAGVPIQVFAETGKRPQIPGPLIRVPVGTLVVARVHNALPGTVLTMHGMVSRPTDRDSAVHIPYAATKVIRFRSDAPGTFLYWGATSAKTIDTRFRSDSQLSGAMVVDPRRSGASQNDRIFVISQWGNVLEKDGSPDGDYELDTINGRSWPYTERLTYDRGATVKWRVVNASFEEHPFHLHGFFFTVDSRGDGLADTIYTNAADRDHVVTQLVLPGNTFTMTWHADRPGKWLFHCHIPYHVIGHVPIAAMLAGKKTITDTEYENQIVRHAGMGGLILGVTVRPPKRQQAVPEPPVAQHIQLQVQAAPDDLADAPSIRAIVTEAGHATVEPGSIGPPIVLTRGVSTAVDVTNMLSEPTTIHWHGMELGDSYYDGVAGYSGEGKHVAPMIDPGKTFEALLTPPRAGTFIYHTHMDDIWQARGGLAGPLIVLEPGVRFDPTTDHVFTVTTTHALKDALKINVNGLLSPPAVTCRVGVLQRFRLINMTTFWPEVLVSLSQNDRTTVQWRPLAVDGATLPGSRQRPQPAFTTVTIGETRDFTFNPKSPGDYQLEFWPDPRFPHIVTVAIHVVP